MTMFTMPDLHIGISLYDKNNDLKISYREPGHSWTRNGYMLLLATMTDVVGDEGGIFGAGYLASKATDNSVQDDLFTGNRGSSVCPTTANGAVNSSSGITLGIIAGTDDTVFSAEDNILGALASTLTYQAQVAPVASYNAATDVWTVTHTRIIYNGSGGTITVKEVGIYWKGALFSSATNRIYLIARDVLTTPVALTNLDTLRIDYDMSVDFSAIDA